jgi:mono/diheme cytochrome c family protein
MTAGRTRAVAIAGVLVAMMTVPARTQEPPQNPDGPRAVVQRYCQTCHNARTKAGGLQLDQLDADHPDRDPQSWEKVVRKLRTGMMPPAGAPRPERVTLDRLAASVETALDRAAAAAPNPGAAVLHRLNRAEYANAVRDLLDLPIDAAAMLPGDDSSDGFDNIATVLSVSPALMQAYVSAAEKISRLAVGDPTTTSEVATYPAPRGLSQADTREGFSPGTRGGFIVQHVFPLEAEYEFRVTRTAGGFGLPAVGTEEPVEIAIDGARLMMIGRDTPRGTRVRVPAGPHAVGVSVVRQANARGVDDLFAEWGISSGVGSLTIVGPANPTGPGETASRRRIFICRPARPEDETPCARRTLAALATRAYRRPVPEQDPSIDILMGFYTSGRERRGFDTGIQYALARVLVDPRFIFRFEREPVDARGRPLPDGAVYRLDNFELASRLSFFLWSSVPDEELLAAAKAGTLTNPAVLERQTRRMLGDPKADALVDNLAGQWLLLRQLDAISPGTKEFDGNLRYAFRRETELLFETILRDDRSVLDLLDADFTFVDERLARHYGIPNVSGSRFRRVALGDGPRRGLLGQGSVLTATSAGSRTSPVKRGKWILENLLGAPVPNPPPGVETNLEKSVGPAAADTSLRQRLERHRANPSCASCHAVMDPIGFALENYDLIGKWRDTDSGVPVNASGKLVDGTPLDGPASLRRALLARREAFVTNTTEKLLTYALGRRIEYFDMPAVRGIAKNAGPDDHFSSLVVGIVKSVPFQMKRKEGDAQP